jgi:hypothetical protein
MANTRVPKKIGAPIHPRAGWDAEFAKMATCGDDALLDAPVPTRWDESEWTMNPIADPLVGKKPVPL